ncbi:MAG: PH domain-containing protein [Acidobacteria bacterium]|nr:PH domain-containing protein [Acidobacteriota bacterium]
MFCPKCGAENADDSLFCKKCGTSLDDEEVTRLAQKPGAVSKRPADDIEERRIFSITPTLKFVWLGYILTAFLALLLVAILSVFLPAVGVVPGVVLGLFLFVIPAFYHIRKKLVRYTLSDSKLEIDTGLISRTTVNVPLRRIQDVTVRASVFQRILGFGDIIVDNAGTDGTQVILKDIDAPRRYADMMLRQMREADHRKPDSF